MTDQQGYPTFSVPVSYHIDATFDLDKDIDYLSKEKNHSKQSDLTSFLVSPHPSIPTQNLKVPLDLGTSHRSYVNY